MKEVHEFHLYSVYFAPRGRERLLSLGEQLSIRHMSFRDKLIGIVGDTGSGKSLIIKGIFPGLILANDDDTIDVHKIMQVRHDLDKDFANTTYHLDMRFQLAFTQMFEIVDFVKGALNKGRRVIVEHFDLLYPYIKINADVMIGIGDEIIVTRPNMFGPLPGDIAKIVFASLKYRKMAHTAEDLTTLFLLNEFKTPFQLKNSDVRNGFVLNFSSKPELDIGELEQRVKEIIDKGVTVSYYDEDHIQIGEDYKLRCTGPRIHVRNTSEIEKFQLIKDVVFDEVTEMYSLIGIVGCDELADINDLNKIALSHTLK